MNEFELFTMIFYAVDAYYEENPSNDMKAFLGMMSPFTFKEVDSADSAIYTDFQKFIKGRTITLENSLSYAVEYSKTVDNCDIMKVFDNITESDWMTGCIDYLSKPHKGQAGF